MGEDYWLVICRQHGLVGSGIATELYAHGLADQHDHHVGADECDLRVLTEDDWEELKLASDLEPSRSSRDTIGVETP